MNRTCLACGWVHFGVTRERAEAEVNESNAFFDTLSVEDRREYYNGAVACIEQYERCFRCGGPYTNFRDTRDGDCPDGCTLQPIIADQPGAVTP